MNAVLVSEALLAELCPGCRSKIGAAFGFVDNGAPVAAAAAGQLSGDVSPAGLSVSDMKEFLNGCSPKTTAVLSTISGLGASFELSAVAAAQNSSPGDLRTVWSGLTRRVRTITRNPDALLVDWVKEGTDWIGVMAPETHASLQKVLSERPVVSK